VREQNPCKEEVLDKLLKLLDSPGLSEIIDVPQRTLDQWAYLGKGPAFIKIGKHRRYRPEDVDAWLDANRRGGDAA
jgi:hypothetical protein